MGKYKVMVDNYDSKRWSLNGITHRELDPAFEVSSCTKYWYLNGIRHREDGPAIEYAGGYKAWYLYGEGMSEDEYAIRINEQI